MGFKKEAFFMKEPIFILTSDFSFSCANMLPTLVKNRGAKSSA